MHFLERLVQLMVIVPHIGIVTLSLGTVKLDLFFCKTFNLSDYHLLHPGDSEEVSRVLFGVDDGLLLS